VGKDAAFEGLKAVFFDLDDTLCAYWDAVRIGLRETFERFELEGVSTDTMIDHWAAAFRGFCPGIKQSEWYEGYLKQGEPTRTELMRRCLERAGCRDADRAKTMADFYASARLRALALFPDAKAALIALGRRLQLGLITNGPADVQRQEIRALGLEGRFRHILIEGELGIGKPDPRVFDLALSLCEAEPSQALFVGNSYAHDVLPAIRAGWKTVWIRRESDVPPSAGAQGRPLERVPPGEPEPDRMLTELSSLPAMLGIEPTAANASRLQSDGYSV
jgi:HAD superfamily hydrolase (TIGR01509 family)